MGRKKVESPQPDAHGRVTVINLKGPQEDRDYVEELTRTTLIPAASIVRDAVAAWAKQKKLPAPPWVGRK